MKKLIQFLKALFAPVKAEAPASDPKPFKEPEKAAPLKRKYPRGFRNKNPGNIRRNAIKWQGMAKDQTDSEFVTFVSPECGLRALFKVLMNYNRKHGLRSVNQIINRWAPPTGDRNGSAPGGTYTQNTSAYVQSVSKKLGVKPGDRLPILTDDELFVRLAQEIVVHENGSGLRFDLPRTWYRKDVYVRALNLAKE